MFFDLHLHNKCYLRDVLKCLLVGCLSRLLKSRWVLRGKRCSCKYLMRSRRWACPAFTSRQKWTPDCYYWAASDVIRLLNRERGTEEYQDKNNSGKKAVSLSPSVFVLCVGQKRNASIKCAVKLQGLIWAVNWLKLRKNPCIIFYRQDVKAVKIWLGVSAYSSRLINH